MPRLTWCNKQQKEPEPIDWEMAAILYRKHSRRLKWEDIAARTGMSGEAFRKMATTKPPRMWPEKVRNSVHSYLDIQVKAQVSVCQPGA